MSLSTDIKQLEKPAVQEYMDKDNAMAIIVPAIIIAKQHGGFNYSNIAEEESAGQEGFDWRAGGGICAAGAPGIEVFNVLDDYIARAGREFTDHEVKKKLEAAYMTKMHNMQLLGLVGGQAGGHSEETTQLEKLLTAERATNRQLRDQG